MHDFSFNRKTLNREFRAIDFKLNTHLVDAEQRKSILITAEQTASRGFNNLLLEHSVVRGRELYQFMSIPQELVLRKLSRNLKTLTRVRQDNRDSIVKNLLTLLREGEDFRVYKLDIQNFYPSISRSEIDRNLRRDGGFPATSYFVWKSFKEQLDQKCIPGVPPGLSISATLSEFYMRQFDEHMKIMEGVYFYSRFVDDMVILTTVQNSEKDTLSLIRNRLPSGLKLNRSKSHTLTLTGKPEETPSVDKYFDFLGYRFDIFQKKIQKNNPIQRTVIVDISTKKIKRIKTRILLSFLQYAKDGIFSDLEDRIKCLSGNYHIYDFEKSLRRNVGIYFNYRNVDHANSTALKDLDSFISKIVLSRNGRIAQMLRRRMGVAERNKLLKYSFSNSFKEKTHYHFNPEHLAHLTGSWKYE